MAFAKQDFDFSYWQKQTSPLFADLAWNIPEQKTGRVDVVGGNTAGFHGVMKFAETLAQGSPVKTVSILLPDALQSKVPPLANLSFAPSTESGSFAKSSQLNEACSSGDFTVLAGDFSRNSATAAALSSAIQISISNSSSGSVRATARDVEDTDKSSITENIVPLLVMRDGVDLLVQDAAILLAHPKLFLVASMAQLQKIFRAIYYPRMLMLSQPLAMTVETLHKFTLSYPATILTFHDQQIIVAQGGKIASTPLVRTKYSLLELWSGSLAAKVVAYNLFNPSQPFAATNAAILAE